MITAIDTDAIRIAERNLDRSMGIEKYVEYSVVAKVKKIYRYVKYTNSHKSLIEKWGPILGAFNANVLENLSVKKAIEHQLLKKFPLVIYYPPITQTSP